MQALPLFQSKQKKPQKKIVTENQETAPQHIGQVLLKETTQEAQKAVSEMWREILGIKKQTQDMQPNVSYDVKGNKENHHQENAQARGAIDYAGDILHPGKNNETQKSEQRIMMLVGELKKLSTSVKQVEKAVILQALGPSEKAKAGKYYESFFEWMILMVQDARRTIEDSGAWLQTMNAKSKRKQQVGKVKTSMNLFLSGERTAQNQAG